MKIRIKLTAINVLVTVALITLITGVILYRSAALQQAAALENLENMSISIANEITVRSIILPLPALQLLSPDETSCLSPPSTPLLSAAPFLPSPVPVDFHHRAVDYHFLKPYSLLLLRLL
jgi:hypothetical protein